MHWHIELRARTSDLLDNFTSQIRSSSSNDVDSSPSVFDTTGVTTECRVLPIVAMGKGLLVECLGCMLFGPSPGLHGYRSGFCLDVSPFEVSSIPDPLQAATHPM